MRTTQRATRVLIALGLLALGLGAQDIPGWNGLAWGASKTTILKRFAGKIKSQEGPAVTTNVVIGDHSFNAILSLKEGGLDAVRLMANHITGDAAPLVETVREGLVAKYGTPSTDNRLTPWHRFYKWLRRSGSVALMYSLTPGDASVLISYERASDPL